jgi:hypothetical protein
MAITPTRAASSSPTKYYATSTSPTKPPLVPTPPCPILNPPLYEKCPKGGWYANPVPKIYDHLNSLSISTTTTTSSYAPSSSSSYGSASSSVGRGGKSSDGGGGHAHASDHVRRRSFVDSEFSYDSYINSSNPSSQFNLPPPKRASSAPSSSDNDNFESKDRGDVVMGNSSNGGREQMLGDIGATGSLGLGMGVGTAVSPSMNHISSYDQQQQPQPRTLNPFLEVDKYEKNTAAAYYKRKKEYKQGKGGEGIEDVSDCRTVSLSRGCLARGSNFNNCRVSDNLKIC